MLGIIGGSSLPRLTDLEATRQAAVRTPYGEPSSALTFGKLRGREVVFLARHGYGNSIPPHEVNYRANLWALRDCGCRDVVSIASVGGIRADFTPGTLVVPDQIIDYTSGRASTYVTSSDRPVQHVDFTHPYCESLRRRLLRAAAAVGVSAADGGTYAVTQGPRLESAAEINRLERDGADIVGMTGMPEAALAREIELCYAPIAVVVNPAAGRGASREGIRFDDFQAVSQRAMAETRRILAQLAVDDGG